MSDIVDNYYEKVKKNTKEKTVIQLEVNFSVYIRLISLSICIYDCLNLWCDCLRNIKKNTKKKRVVIYNSH